MRAEFEDSYNELLAAVEGLSQEQLDDLRLRDQPDRGTFAQMIAGNTYEHYEEHIPLLEALGGE